MQDWGEVQKLRYEIPPNGIVIISPLNSLHSPPSYRLIGDLCQGLGLFKLLLQMSFFPPRLCSRSSLGLLELSLPQVWGQHFFFSCCRVLPPQWVQLFIFLQPGTETAAGSWLQGGRQQQFVSSPSLNIFLKRWKVINPWTIIPNSWTDNCLKAEVAWKWWIPHFWSSRDGFLNFDETKSQI